VHMHCYMHCFMYCSMNSTALTLALVITNYFFVATWVFDLICLLLRQFILQYSVLNFTNCLHPYHYNCSYTNRQYCLRDGPSATTGDKAAVALYVEAFCGNRLHANTCFALVSQEGSFAGLASRRCHSTHFSSHARVHALPHVRSLLLIQPVHIPVLQSLRRLRFASDHKLTHAQTIGLVCGPFTLILGTQSPTFGTRGQLAGKLLRNDGCCVRATRIWEDVHSAGWRVG
jgi:hypothetical protein